MLNQCSFVITPNVGWYIKSITYNDKNISAFDAYGTTFMSPPLTKNLVLYVSFSKIINDTPKVISTPFIIKSGRSVFFFGKILNDSSDISEYGILFSKSNSDLNVNSNNVIKVKGENRISSKGYFGFEIRNNSAISELIYYLRPYIIYKGEVILAEDTIKIDTSEVKNSEDYLKFNDWIEQNNLNDAGIIRYIIN